MSFQLPTLLLYTLSADVHHIKSLTMLTIQPNAIRGNGDNGT
jgi:hypothetical protein